MIVPHNMLALQNTKVFIVGDVILDAYIEGKVARISPEAPVPVVLENNRRYVPGGAGNVAANIAAFGAEAHLCGRIGNDEEAGFLKAALTKFGIQIDSLLVSSKLPTTIKMRVVSGSLSNASSQQIVRVDKEVLLPITSAEEHAILDKFKKFIALGGARAVVISDYGKGVLTKNLISSLMELSKSNGIPVITDPKSQDVARYAGSTVIKPNLSEGRSVLRTHQPGSSFFDFEEEVEAIADCYLNASGCENLVMSLSEHGVMARGTHVSNTVRFETKALQVADVSGAGDTLVAFLAMGCAAQLSLAQATELGNLAAGLVCGKQGTATVTLSEILETFHDVVHPAKIVSLEDFKLISKQFRKQNVKTVFTNGCFDILHAGHVDYLQKAKAMGDILVIGLNSDESVTRLKGPTRPVQKGIDRAQILAAMACVDFVIEFAEDTPIEVIRAIKPDVLVKGADYTLETTVGAADVLSWGGRVEHVGLLPGRSTTSILKK